MSHGVIIVAVGYVCLFGAVFAFYFWCLGVIVFGAFSGNCLCFFYFTDVSVKGVKVLDSLFYDILLPFIQFFFCSLCYIISVNVFFFNSVSNTTFYVYYSYCSFL